VKIPVFQPKSVAAYLLQAPKSEASTHPVLEASYGVTGFPIRIISGGTPAVLIISPTAVLLNLLPSL